MSTSSGHVPAPPPDSSAPDEIPGIRLTGELGHGGFGTVYLGRDTVVGRDVAVKIDQRTLEGESDRRRFAREVTAAGQVSAHPNIVTLLSGGVTSAGRPYLVMELCPGGSLDARLKEHGALPPADVIHVGIAIADALAAAHAVGILHRDVKPANILVTEYGTPALADFGLASLPAQWDIATMSQHALTPSFAAPESFERKTHSPQADVYSLGATLYSLLVGRPPRWTASGPPSLAEMVELSREPLPWLDIPGFPGLMEAIAQATAPDPAERTATAATLRDQLLAVAKETLPEGNLRRHAPAIGLGRIPVPGPGVGPRTASVDPQVTPNPVSGSPVRIPGGGPNGTALLPEVDPRAATPSGSGPAGFATEQVGPPAGPGAPPGSFAASGPMSEPGPKRPRRARRALLAACGVAVLAGGIWAAVALQNEGDQDHVAADPSADGRSTTGTHDSSTSAIAPADLPREGSCWGGLVIVGGQAPTANERPCTEEHRWEAFAVGTLAPDTDYTLADSLEADPVVVRTCTTDRLAQYLGRNAPEDVEISALGPREALANHGDRTFVCLADYGLNTPMQ